MNTTENKILIITGGKIEDSFLLERVSQEQYQMIIAADRGLEAADRLNIKLDFILGDFDSVPESVLNRYREKSTPIKTFPAKKDKTDTEIAVEYAMMQHPTVIDIIGATGSRLDHVLANIHLLMSPMQQDINACLLDPNNRIYLKNKSFTIKKETQYGNFVSLLPFSDKVSGLTLKGFKYPLDNITYTAGSSLGISNEIIESEARVELSEGILTVIEAKD